MEPHEIFFFFLLYIEYTEFIKYYLIYSKHKTAMQFFPTVQIKKRPECTAQTYRTIQTLPTHRYECLLWWYYSLIILASESGPSLRCYIGLVGGLQQGSKCVVLDHSAMTWKNRNISWFEPVSFRTQPRSWLLAAVHSTTTTVWKKNRIILFIMGKWYIYSHGGVWYSDLCSWEAASSPSTVTNIIHIEPSRNPSFYQVLLLIVSLFPLFLKYYSKM